MLFIFMKGGRLTQTCKICLIFTCRDFRRQPVLSHIKVYFPFRSLQRQVSTITEHDDKMIVLRYDSSRNLFYVVFCDQM